MDFSDSQVTPFKMGLRHLWKFYPQWLTLGYHSTKLQMMLQRMVLLFRNTNYKIIKCLFFQSLFKFIHDEKSFRFQEFAGWDRCIRRKFFLGGRLSPYHLLQSFLYLLRIIWSWPLSETGYWTAWNTGTNHYGNRYFPYNSTPSSALTATRKGCLLPASA